MATGTKSKNDNAQQPALAVTKDTSPKANDITNELRKLHERAQQMSDLPHRILEQDTIVKIILPFFRAFGWDESNFSQWVEQYRVGDRGHADHAIIFNGAPAILIESKTLRASLSSPSYQEQVSRYFNGTETHIAILTNGQEYWFYSYEGISESKIEPFAKVNLADIDLTRADAPLMALCRYKFRVNNLCDLSKAVMKLRAYRMIIGHKNCDVNTVKLISDTFTQIFPEKPSADIAKLVSFALKYE